MPEILHIDLEGFFIAVERQLRPELAGRPVVIGGQPSAWGRVVAASPEAAVRGVRPGLSLAIAAERCRDAVFLDGAVDRYLEASAAVDELIRDPGLVGAAVPVEWAAIDSVFLDLSAAGPAVGHGRRIAERLQATIARELGFDVACGLAGTRIAAQVASRLSRPRGLLYVLPGYEGRLLASLDVGLLPDLTSGARQRLMQEGVATLGGLAAMDAQQARRVLGGRSGVWQQWARGIDPRPVDGGLPPRSLAREVTLAQAELDDAKAEAVVQHMVETLAARLRQMGWFAQTVSVRVRTATPAAAPGRRPGLEPAASAAESRTLTMREATALERDLQATARALFRAVWRHRPLAGIGIVLSNLQRVGPQMPLFPVRRPSLADSHDGVRSRSGFRALVEGRYLRARAPQRRVG
jgi:DNA polymerase-4